MTDIEKIACNNLLHTLRGGDAHLSFEQVIDGFPERDMNARLPHVAYTPWQVLWHIWFCQYDLLHYGLSADYRWPKFPDGYWPPADKEADQTEWDKTVADFHRDHAHVVASVEDASVELFSPLSWGIAPGHSLYRNFVVMADHNAYHIGELGLWRAILNNWPSGQRRDPGILG